MKLGTVRDGSRDGLLAVVRRDLSAYAPATGIARSLQEALDEWEEREPRLRELAERLERGEIASASFDPARFHSPLPRAYEWVDASAYLNHVRLVRKARGVEPPPTLETDPLVYQGGGGHLLGPTEDIPLRDPNWGCDFESEVCVILGDTPMGTRAQDAGRCVRLVTICNDVSLRNVIPAELAKGFGFFQGKPASSFGPVAVTPDELGPAWRDGRVFLRLRTSLNGRIVGETETGPEMHFSFFQLIEHIARTRRFTAGTILGSGTVSNEDRARGISCIAEQRMIETIESGTPRTPFLQYGDAVEIELFDDGGRSVVGAIRQKVVPA